MPKHASKYRLLVLVFVLLVAPGGRADAGQPQVLQITFDSPLLSKFFHQPVELGGEVLLPDSYYKEPDRRYPVIYVVPAFEGTDVVDESIESQWQRPMRSLGAEFVIVFLQAMMEIDGEEIHTELADSATNGPVGRGPDDRVYSSKPTRTFER